MHKTPHTKPKIKELRHPPKQALPRRELCAGTLTLSGCTSQLPESLAALSAMAH